jgi:transposase InsO family protein
VQERKKLVDEHERGIHSVAELCRRFGISRKTGYKWWHRYRAEGEAGLVELSRAPLNPPHRLDEAVEEAVVRLRTQKKHRGPKKLRVALLEEFDEAALPSLTTLANVLARHGLSRPRVRRRHAVPGASPLADVTECNRTWCIDFKGWFRTRDGRRVDPLTITDAHSRYLLCLQAFWGATDTEHVRAVLERVFREYGLPERLRSDNGPPFASTGLMGLSRLSVWWMRLGIVPERIEPGHPEQNGRHERFHLTLLTEALDPPAATPRAQQREFVRYRREYNAERPHEALGQKTPASLYGPSPRPYPRVLPPMPDYPDDWAVRKVRPCGAIKWGGREVHVTDALAGEYVGLEPTEHAEIYRLHFLTVPLARFDVCRLKLKPLEKGQ